MTAISNLNLPQLEQTIRGIIFMVPQDTVDRVPTKTYMIGDDSGEIRVVYAEDGEFSAEMFMLENGDRVELGGVRLPRGKGEDTFYALSGMKIKRVIK